MQEHEQWLQIAKEDLLAAKGLLKLELFSSTVYHCQQTAEKSLKAYLAFQQYHTIKTHDLTNLLELCIKYNGSFEQLSTNAKLLNPFSTKFRYPTEFDIPTFDDAKAAINQAQSIMNFVIKKISEPSTNQTNLLQN